QNDRPRQLSYPHPNQFFIFFQREPLHPVRCGGFFWFCPVSKSNKSAETNRNMFQDVTHCSRKIEQILNMFQKRTQRAKK
ncbi:MAG: hypothetical protein ACLTQP_02800, partial [Faecalibacterium prausnitzii]